jgi:hypothetical protein
LDWWAGKQWQRGHKQSQNRLARTCLVSRRAGGPPISSSDSPRQGFLCNVTSLGEVVVTRPKQLALYDANSTRSCTPMRPATFVGRLGSGIVVPSSHSAVAHASLCHHVQMHLETLSTSGLIYLQLLLIRTMSVASEE